MTIPAFRRKIIEPLHGLKTGSSKLRYWKELERTQYLSEEVLRKRQWERFQSIIRYVYHNNRFYKKRFDEADVHHEDIKAPEDIINIPILTKEDIRRNTVKMISNCFSIDDLLKFKTGGSTGKPLEFYITEECSEMRNACARRHSRWTGWEAGEPIGALWGNPILPKDIKSKLKNRLLTPTICLDTMNVTEESVKQFAKEWEKVKPTLLFGHAHSIYMLAQYVQNLSISSIQPKGIISTSMMLLPHERKTIENVLGVKVFDRYGCEEVSLIAAECERHEGMHLNIEHLFIEFLREDGSHTSPGEPGKIIVTDLMNMAMPFIRYQVEDFGVSLDRKCSCGRGLPLMDKVTGRIADFLVKKDGTRVAGVSLIENTLTKISGIEQMQIVQEALDVINLNVVQGEDFDKNRQEELIRYFKNLFGQEISITILPVKEIRPERSGKYRFSICKIQTNIS